MNLYALHCWPLKLPSQDYKSFLFHACTALWMHWYSHLHRELVFTASVDKVCKTIFFCRSCYLYLFHFCTATSVLKFAGSARITIINVIELFIWLCKTVVMIASLICFETFYWLSNAYIWAILYLPHVFGCPNSLILHVISRAVTLLIFCSNALSFLGYDWCFVLSLLKCKFNILSS